MENIRICPICNSSYDGYPALSRRDNETLICPECGAREALEDYFKYKAKEKENENIN